MSHGNGIEVQSWEITVTATSTTSGKYVVRGHVAKALHPRTRERKYAHWCATEEEAVRAVIGWVRRQGSSEMRVPRRFQNLLEERRAV